jgi:hypothetical protein
VWLQAFQGTICMPSLPTRAFAMHCLLQLLDCMAAAGPGARSGLEGHLQAVVQCAFGAVEDGAESLRPRALAVLARALRMLCDISVDKGGGDGGGGAGNGEGEGAQLADFAAPYVTAIKTCLTAQHASPLSIAHAAPLAASVLLSGMLSEDHSTAEVCLH